MSDQSLAAGELQTTRLSLRRPTEADIDAIFEIHSDPETCLHNMPARMWPIIAEAAAGTYEEGRQGHGPVTFDDLIAATKFSAIHLEMRDGYDLSDSAFVAWQQTGKHPVDDERDDWWRKLVGGAVARGVRFRRLRVVSEPLSEYVRWEHEITEGLNVAAGEKVRWLPRSKAVGLMLPAHDLWLIDNRIVQFLHFGPDGGYLGEVFTTEPAVVTAVIAAVEAAWDRGVPHEDYKPS